MGKGMCSFSSWKTRSKKNHGKMFVFGCKVAHDF